MKKCPKCGATINDDDNFCIYCGYELNDSTEQSNTTCEYCHKEIQKDQKFCTYCGMEQKEVHVREETEETNNKPLGDLSPLECYKLFWTHAFDFKGHASRREYWSVFWINLVIELAFGFIFGSISALNISNEFLTSIGYTDGLNIINDIIWPLLCFVPTFSIGIRRLHDVGKPWYAILINLIPLVGSFIYVIWLVRPTGYFSDEYLK